MNQLINIAPGLSKTHGLREQTPHHKRMRICKRTLFSVEGTSLPAREEKPIQQVRITLIKEEPEYELDWRTFYKDISLRYGERRNARVFCTEKELCAVFMIFSCFS